MIVIDNLSAHETAAAREPLDGSGFACRYPSCPAYFPDLGPVEMAWPG